MCDLCVHHGRGDKWYLEFENYLFDKIFPEPEMQEEAKRQMIATFAETEWRYAEKDYIRNMDFLRQRVSHGFGAQIATYEEAMQILKLAEEATKREDSLVVVGHCPCTLVYRGTRDYVCIGFGMPVSLSMAIGYGRMPREGLTEFGGAEWRELRRQLRKDAKVPLKLEEARELLLEWEKKGLFHLVMGRGRMPLIEAICNCERPYCTYWRHREVQGIKDYCLKSHYVAVVDPDACTGCGACVEQCQFGALHNSVWAGLAYIDPTRCFGCGICRVPCRYDAIDMVPREQIPVARDLW